MVERFSYPLFRHDCPAVQLETASSAELCMHWELTRNFCVFFTGDHVKNAPISAVRGYLAGKYGLLMDKWKSSLCWPRHAGVFPKYFFHTGLSPVFCLFCLSGGRARNAYKTKRRIWRIDLVLAKMLIGRGCVAHLRISERC